MEYMPMRGDGICVKDNKMRVMPVCNNVTVIHDLLYNK
jgi:hypothetical protein